MRILNGFMACIVTFALVGCNTADTHSKEKDKDKKEPETAFGQSKPQKAKAILKPTKNSQVHGVVLFSALADGVKIVADVDGLTPGNHGFHIHEKGDCSAADGSSAGGHFNPDNKKHGAPDSAIRHVGDLGNLEADETGHAHYERIDTVIALDGPHSIIGRSIIVHTDPDDFTTQPTGNSGPRVACGLIESHSH